MASNSAGHVLTAPFNKSVKVTGHHSEKLTSDAGVLLLRSLFMLTGLTARLAAVLSDSRIPGRITHRFDELLQSVLLLLAQGRMRQRDMRRLRHEAAMRLAASMKAGMGDGKPLASQPTISRLLRRLGTKKNLARLSDFVTTFAMERLLHARGGKRYDTLVMDIDGLPVDAHARQQAVPITGTTSATSSCLLLPVVRKPVTCWRHAASWQCACRKRLLQLYQEDGSQAANGCGPEGDRAVGRGPLTVERYAVSWSGFGSAT